MTRVRRNACVLALAAFACACSSGTQILGYERGEPDAAGPADTYQPWFGGPGYYERWPNGLSTSPNHFPIGVWMQSPANSERYRAVGINLFIGLWEGPTDEQLDALPAPEMSTFCGQDGVWRTRLDDAAISGWMHDDSPDNAVERDDGSYGPCIEPSVMQQRYAAMSTADRSRPVFLLLGQGVGDPEWPGRGSCSGRDDMYPEYAEAGDVLGFYQYPLSRGRPLELVGDGVQRLLAWSQFEKPVFALIEASNMDGVVRPTPDQIRAEAWLALVRGAAGIAYFCHRFMPDFSETDCLDDAPTRQALARINAEIAELAPALNSPPIVNGTVVSTAEIDTRLSRAGGVTYLFAAAASAEPTHARFMLPGLPPTATAEVIGEDREIGVEDGELEDDFAGYDVHLYRIATPP